MARLNNSRSGCCALLLLLEPLPPLLLNHAKGFQLLRLLLGEAGRGAGGEGGAACCVGVLLLVPCSASSLPLPLPEVLLPPKLLLLPLVLPLGPVAPALLLSLDALHMWLGRSRCEECMRLRLCGWPSCKWLCWAAAN